MRIKIENVIKVIIILLVGLFVCLGLYYMVDNIWNGAFLDWFSQNYMFTHEAWDGSGRIVSEPSWDKIKPLLLIVLCLNVIFWLLIVFLVSRLQAKERAKTTVTEISQMIHGYMAQGEEAAELCPKEYEQIAAQMARIKSAMDHHEQTLKDEARRKSDLIAYLAHDLKTPLTSVIGYLSLLDEARDMPEEQKVKYVNITLDKACRLEKLINEFFDITRYNLQQINLEKETIDLYYMLVQMTDEFYPILNAHGNKTILKVDENLIIYGDSMKLARVFNNILKNAIAYSYENTAIEIWAERAEKETIISFRNKGKTIPKQKLDIIFDKFFRLDEARATNTGGAGLGLAIAKEIVELHQGNITASSANELTVFSVSLPDR